MPWIILVADDNLGTRLSVSDYLEMSGLYSVITAEDGQDALSKIETCHPHVLVTDINMPRMDGYELVKQVRHQPSFRYLPVVFLTERTGTRTRIDVYKSGGDVYLPKPFEMEELAAIVGNLVERLYTRQNFPLDLIIDKRIPQEALSPKSNGIKLSQREKDVLELLLAKGLSNVEIGDKLNLSPRTVEKYVSSLLRKTGTNKRTELLRFALENSLLD